MNRQFAMTIVLLLIGTCICAAQFEGKIEMTLTSDDGGGGTESVTYSMYLKPGRIAAELHSDGGQSLAMRSVFDSGSSLLSVIDDSRKVYVEIPLKNGNLVFEPGDSLPVKIPPPAVKGKKLKNEKLLGKKCEVWEFREEGEKTTVWGAPGYTDLLETMSRFISAMGSLFGEQRDAAWELMKEKRLFPIRVVTVTDDAMKETQEITSIERKSIPASHFDVPSGYVKQESLEMLPMENDQDSEDEADEPD